jgi:hypothetical protein
MSYQHPDDGRTLAELLAVSQRVSAVLAPRSVEDLRLSVRATNCFRKSRIRTVGDLLSATPSELLQIRNLGRTTQREVVERLREFVGAARSTHQEGARRGGPVGVRRHTLADEWETFGGPARIPPALRLADLPEGSGIALRRLDIGVSRISDVLNLRIDTRDEAASADVLAALLDAIPVLALEARTSIPGHLRPAPPELREILARRWVDVPVSDLGFRRTTRSILCDAGLLTLGRLLEAVDPLSPFLYLDLGTFQEVWARLVTLGLRSGDALEVREGLASRMPVPLSLDVLTEFCEQACTPRQWIVLQRRYGLAGPSSPRSPRADRRSAVAGRATLRDVGEELGLSREGVRHVERAAIKRVVASRSPLHPLGRTLKLLLHQSGGVLSLADTARLLARYMRPGSYSAQSICYLTYELSDGFVALEPGSIYGLGHLADDYPRVIASARSVWGQERDHAFGEQLVVQLVEELRVSGTQFNAAFVRACLTAKGGFMKAERRKWTYKDLAEKVLRDAGEPMHFSEIAGAAERLRRRASVTLSGLHNALHYDKERFAWVSPGTYGLREWGLESVETFPALIAQSLTAKGRPLTKGELFAAVNSRRPIQPASLTMFLDLHPRFYRCVDGRYGLRAWLPPRDRQTLRTPSWQVEDAASFERVEAARKRGYDVDALVLQDKRAQET